MMSPAYFPAKVLPRWYTGILHSHQYQRHKTLGSPRAHARLEQRRLQSLRNSGMRSSTQKFNAASNNVFLDIHRLPRLKVICAVSRKRSDHLDCAHVWSCVQLAGPGF